MSYQQHYTLSGAPLSTGRLIKKSTAAYGSFYISTRVRREASDGGLRVLRWKRAVSEWAYLEDPTHSIRAIDARAVIGVPRGIERNHITGCT